MTISINPQGQLPTVSAERSKDIHLFYYEPQAFGSVFTVDCTNMFVHFQPPHREEYRLELPPEDRLGQYVSELRDSEMIVSKVIRGKLVTIVQCIRFSNILLSYLLFTDSPLTVACALLVILPLFNHLNPLNYQFQCLS